MSTQPDNQTTLDKLKDRYVKGFDENTSAVKDGLVPQGLFEIGLAVAERHGLRLVDNELKDIQDGLLADKEHDAATWPVARVLFKKEAGKHDFSWISLETKATGDVHVDFGSDRTEGDTRGIAPKDDVNKELKRIIATFKERDMLPADFKLSSPDEKSRWKPKIPAVPKVITFDSLDR